MGWDILRWVAAAALAVAWAAIAWFNASCIWRPSVSGRTRTSMVPFPAFLLAVAAAGAAPLEPRHRWPLLMAAALLDAGCLPFFALTAWFALKERLGLRGR